LREPGRVGPGCGAGTGCEGADDCDPKSICSPRTRRPMAAQKPRNSGVADLDWLDHPRNRGKGDLRFRRRADPRSSDRVRLHAQVREFAVERRIGATAWAPCNPPGVCAMIHSCAVRLEPAPSFPYL
jgi:hypothetical protein